MAKIDLNLNVQGVGDLDKLNDELEQSKASVRILQHELDQLKKNGYKSDIDSIAKAIGGMDKSVGNLASKMKTSSTETSGAIKKIATAMIDLQKRSDVAATGAKAMVQDYRVAARELGRVEDQISQRQGDLIGKKLKQLANGEINTTQFQEAARKISKVYADALDKRLDISTMSKNQLAYEKNMAEVNAKFIEKKLVGESKALAIQKESERKEEQAKKLGAEKLAQEKEITAQKEKQTQEVKKQQEARTRTDLARAGKAESQQRVAESKERAYEEQAWANEVYRQQKLEKNERARLILREQMYAMANGEYQLAEKQAQKMALATSRLKDTATNIQNFAKTAGFKGTVGAEATSILRSEQFYQNIMNYALAWKRVNSEEGKAADQLGRMIVDAKGLQSGINRIHTAFGQLASVVSATRQVGVEFRKGLMAIAQPLLNIVNRVSSQAFKTSIDALRKLELSEIGFSNFFGQSAVQGIMQNVKQEALLSPLSAAQLASYVNQIAPLSGGNSQLALNAAMGVAKMIQYSGGEVTTEMEYVVRNLRDVIAKGKATTIDVRQFNRAMPAFKKVLQEMGLEEFLKDGEISISKETAPRLLEAFQRVNEYGDVGTIFERTSQTISGLLERVEEQVQFLLIDVAEFSGLTDLIKSSILDFLEDSDGLLSDIRMHAQFIGRDIVSWLKTRDWERVLNTAKEIANVLWTGLKDSLGILKGALGGTDWRETLINLAETIASFIKGIANSYSWLLGIMNGLNKSGILGSGFVQGAAGLLGFLSGNAGALLTGGFRSFGNFMGVLNQMSFFLITSMEQQQQAYLKSAMTLNTFDEALMIVAQSLTGVAKDILLIDETLGGVLTIEQRKMIQDELAANQTEMNTLKTQANTVAKHAERTAVIANTQATHLNTQAKAANSGAQKASLFSGGGGLLGPGGLKGGTKLGTMFNQGFRALFGGILAGTLASGITEGLANFFGADKQGAANAGNWGGSIAGFATSGAMIGGAVGHPIIGAIVGAGAGIIKAIFEQTSILDQSRIEQLEKAKEEVNSGVYLKQLLDETEDGNHISSQEFDAIKANMVKQMNQWSESTPKGTAQMLKDYLREIEYNGKSLKETIKGIAEENSKRAETLWSFIEKDEIDKGNEYAATLKELGMSSFDISAMILGQAAKHGKSRDQIIDYLLKWGSTNDASGADLTYETIQGMSGSDLQATKDKLLAAWTTIGQESVQNLDLSNEDKVAISRAFAESMVKFITGSFDDMSDENWMYLHRFFNRADLSNVSDQLGYSMSPSAMQGMIWDRRKWEKYGLTPGNAGIWGSSYKGHGAEDEFGNPLGTSTTSYDTELVNRMTEGMTAQERWQWLEDNIEEYGRSTQDVIDDWLKEIKAKEEEANSIGQSQEKTLWEIRDNTNLLLRKDFTVKIGDTLEDTTPSLITRGQMQKTRNKANGGLIYLAAGGSPRGVDTVPAMLQPGEYVVRRSAVNKVGLSAMNALNTGNLGYFARVLGRQNIYGDYNGARTWNSTSNDNRNYRQNKVIVNNYTRGARLNRYYSLANRLI